MAVSRRRLFKSVALTVGCRGAVEGADVTVNLDVLRNVSAIHGTNLTDDRLRVIKPVLEKSLPQLRALRDFEVDDSVAPTQGILDK
jgi:hypothetical protein